MPGTPDEMSDFIKKIVDEAVMAERKNVDEAVMAERKNNESFIRGIVEEALSNSPWIRCKVVGIKDAAAQLNKSPHTIREWVTTGKLPATKVGNNWDIPVTEILKLQKQHATVFPMPDQRYGKFKSKSSLTT